MDIFVSFLALFSLCAALTLRGRVHSALAPLTALGCITLWLTGAGVAGLLMPGMIVCLAVCFGLGVWAVWPRKNRPAPDFKQLFTPGSMLFWGMALLFAVYFAIRQPMFHDFDEFSFWGTAAKLTCTNHQLYTTVEIGWPWQASQNPAMILLAYFVQFLGHFAPWKVYLAYDLLLFACFAAVLGGVKWKNYALYIPAGVICWVSLWFFTVYNRTIELCDVYMTSYGDIPAGVAFGGALALWLGLRHTGGPRWAVLPALILAGNIKGNTFVLALLAGALVAADWWLFPAKADPADPWKKGLLRRTGFAAACVAAPMALYLGWGRYIGHLASLNAQTGGMGETSKDTISVALNGTKMLLGLPVPPDYEVCREQFFTAIADMKKSFYSSKISMLSVGDELLYRLHAPQWLIDAMGSGVLITALILLALLLALIWAGKGQLRHRIAAFTGFSVLGFFAYNYMLALSYGFIFRPDQAASLVDYNRYIYCFYLGWFLAALAFLCLAIRARKDQPIWQGVGKLGVLALAVLMLLRVDQLVLPQFSVLGFSDAAFADQHIQQRRADAVVDAVPAGSRIFLVSQGDNGLDWFEYSLDLLPLILDYSGDQAGGGGGGGTFGIEGLRPGEEDHNRYIYYHTYSPEEFRETVQKSGCAYLFMDRVDDIFLESYGELFSDGLEAAVNGDTLLYQVQEDGLFTPVEMEVPA